MEILQALEAAEGGAPGQQDEQQAGPSAVANANSAAARGDESALPSAAGPSHGMYLMSPRTFWLISFSESTHESCSTQAWSLTT